jgi:signal transduction histidine kinase
LWCRERPSFTPVSLASIVTDVTEFYDAAAEAAGITLVTEIHGQPVTLGEKSLLASAILNLVDNALKYAGSGATAHVRATEETYTVSLVVQDDGPGIPSAERSRVVERFYRLDRSRSLPGNGLGLSIVTAVASLHWGTLDLSDSAPGLIARIVLPNANAVDPLKRALAKTLPADIPA